MSFPIQCQYLVGGFAFPNDVGVACSTNVAEESYAQGFGGENWRKESTWKNSALLVW